MNTYTDMFEQHSFRLTYLYYTYLHSHNSYVIHPHTHIHKYLTNRLVHLPLCINVFVFFVFVFDVGCYIKVIWFTFSSSWNFFSSKLFIFFVLLIVETTLGVSFLTKPQEKELITLLVVTTAISSSTLLATIPLYVTCLSLVTIFQFL